MTPADLVDLEWRLASDEGRPEHELHERDAGQGRGLADDRARIRAWLRPWREEHGGGPGHRLWSAYVALRAGAVVAALAVGYGAGTALLSYDGGHPINVVRYVWVALGVQWVLLLALGGLACAAALGVGPDRVPVLGEVYRLLAWLLLRAAGRLERHEASQEGRARLAAAWGRLRSRASLYRPVESWMLLGLTQAVAVAFNLGLVASLLFLTAFSDLAFGWSTTLDVDAADLAVWVERASAPWSALWPAAVPDGDLVAATRYTRMAGFEGGASPELADTAGAWWRFLVALTIVYGLLPRLVLLTVAALGRARALRDVPLDTPAVAALLARLSAPDVRTQAVQSPSSSSPTDAASPAVTPTLTWDGGRSWLVAWRCPGDSIDLDLVAEHLRSSPERVVELGGADYERDREVHAELLRDPPDAVAVVADAWDAPDAGLRDAVVRIRDGVGPRAPVRVLLRGVDDGPPRERDVQVWRDELARLADAYLAVEVLS